MRVCSVCGVVSAPSRRSFAISSVSLLRWAFRVSTWVIASRRSRSTTAKSPNAVAGSTPRARSFSSTRARLPRTNAKSIITLHFSVFLPEMRTVPSTCNTFHLPYRDAKVCRRSLVVAFSVACCALCLCRCVSREAEAGRDSGHRSVPRRLSRPLPRRTEGAERVQSFSEAGRVLQLVLLRLREYEDGSGTCHDWDGCLYRRSRHWQQCAVG